MAYAKHLVFGLIALCAVSCIKSPELNNFSPTVALPLVDSKLTVFDVLARVDTNDLVIVDENTKLLALVYENEDLSLGLKDLYDPLSIPVNSRIESGTTLPTTVPGSTISISGQVDIDISVPLALYSGVFDALSIMIEAESSFLHPIEMEIGLPTLLSGGQAFVNNLSIPANGSDSQNQNFAPASFSFEPSGNPNTLRVNYAIDIQTNGAPISSSDAIDLTILFNGIDFGSLTLNPGNLSLNIPTDSIFLKIFRNSLGADIEFDFTQPEINLNIINAFDLPFNIFINDLSITDAATDQTIDLLLSNFPNPLEIAPSNGAQPSERNFKIDKSNSNIGTVLTPNDKRVNFSFGGETDAQTGQRYTISKADFLDINLNTSLPLQGYLRNFRLGSIVELELSEEDAELVQSGSLRYTFTNKFPIDVFIQVTYEDESNNLTKTLFETPLKILAAPPVDAFGKVTTPQVSTGDIELPEEDLKALLSSKSVRLDATIGTTNADQQGQVGIFLENEIDFKLGLKAKFQNL